MNGHLSRPTALGLGPAALAAWAALVLAVGVAMTTLHAAVLPAPGLTAVPAGETLTLLHAVDEECACSQRLMDYLEARGRQEGLREKILLVHATEARVDALAARGFEVEPVDEVALRDRYEVSSVPSLVIGRADGSVAYSGSHRPRPQMDPVDLQLAAEVAAQRPVASLPVLGCAVSTALERRLDPFGLKYAWWR